MSNICLWVAVAGVATTSTAPRRANTTNSYKNCELFTGIVVVVVLAYFALDSPSRFSFPLSLSLPLSLLLCTSVSALLPVAAATARHRQRQRLWNRQTKGNGDASSAVSVSFVVSVGASVVRASRRVGQVVCFLYFANIKSIFLAGIICRLTQPQAQRQRQASHELNLLEPAQILTKQKSLAAARCMNYLGSCNLPFARAKCALPPLTPCQHYPPLQLALKLYSLTAVVFSSRSVRFCLLFRKLIIFEDEAASSPPPTLAIPFSFCAFFLALPSQLAFTIYSTISLPP